MIVSRLGSARLGQAGEINPIKSLGITDITDTTDWNRNIWVWQQLFSPLDLEWIILKILLAGMVTGLVAAKERSNVRTILIVSVISAQTILMSPRSCFYFTSRQPWLRYKCPKVNHKASVFTVNIRTHHKQTYSQRITFCSPIILLENPPFILMEIWIKYSQTEIRELLRLFGEKILSDLLHTVRFTQVYVSHSETMGL